MIKELTQKEAISQLKMPPKYEVLLLNDDFTSMDFVVDVLVELFGFAREQAHKLMLIIHNEGSAVCGIYHFEIAETKVAFVESAAKKAGYPLRAFMRKLDV